MTSGKLARRLSAVLFDEAVKRSGLTGAEMIGRLREALGRDSLTRQTFLRWRNGEQPVPGDVYLAAVLISGLTVIELVRTLARKLEAADDPESAEMRSMIRTLWEV